MRTGVFAQPLGDPSDLMKPDNALVNTDCSLKVCDFGLARSLHSLHDASAGQDDLTEYVVHKWYRAPGIVLCPSRYTALIDAWAAGCILSEMLTRGVLFQGNSTFDQQWKIAAIFAVKPRVGWTDKQRAKLRAAAAADTRAHAFSRAFPSGSAWPSLGSMLQFSPLMRWRAVEVLKLPYFVQRCRPLLLLWKRLERCISHWKRVAQGHSTSLLAPG